MTRLEVLVIPPDLMDRLKKKGGLEKLRGSVRFSSLQYLTIWPVECVGCAMRTDEQHGAHGAPYEAATETLTVKLKNYVLLSPEAINLDEANRVKLQGIVNAEAAGADRILGGRSRLRRQGVPLGVAGLSRQHGERRRPAAGGDAGGARPCRPRPARAGCACGRWMCSASRRKWWRRWRRRREPAVRPPAGGFCSSPCRGGFARF